MPPANDKTCNDCGSTLEWVGSIANGKMECPAVWCKSNYEKITPGETLVTTSGPDIVIINDSCNLAPLPAPVIFSPIMARYAKEVTQGHRRWCRIVNLSGPHCDCGHVNPAVYSLDVIEALETAYYGTP